MAEPSYYLKEILPGRLEPAASGAASAEGGRVLVDVVESDVDLYYRMAVEMYQGVAQNNAAGARSVFIVPVGPTFQYRRFVYLCRQMPIDLSRLHLFFMDEYLAPTPADAASGAVGGAVAPGAPGAASGEPPLPPALINLDSPLSFRGFVARELVEPLLAADAADAADAAGVAGAGPAAEAVPGAGLGFSADHVYFPD
ncbi:MAG: hypothetical protein ACLFP6_12875, partial [Spirochaetaceae bacterium]